VRRQPSAAYELALDVALFLAIWQLRDRLPRPGDLFKLYVVLYCCLRFAVDFTRADMRVIADLTIVQVVYVPAVLWFGYQLWKSYRETRFVRQVPREVAIPTL
jgi:prolipoprotein diacylglyceryltransferase